MIWSAEACRLRADEAEKLARTVVYERDRERLRQEAQDWRAHASRMEAHAEHWRAPEPPSPLRGLSAWFMKR